MKAVKVEYTVKPEFVEINKANIQKVMSALKAKPINGMQYSSFTSGDGHFVHINMAKDDATMSQLNDVAEFTAFRMALKASEPIEPPKSTDLSLVDTSFEI